MQMSICCCGGDWFTSVPLVTVQLPPDRYAMIRENLDADFEWLTNENFANNKYIIRDNNRWCVVLYMSSVFKYTYAGKKQFEEIIVS